MCLRVYEDFKVFNVYKYVCRVSKSLKVCEGDCSCSHVFVVVCKYFYVFGDGV